MFIGNKAIVRGSDHTRNEENIPCQDAASFEIVEYGGIEGCKSAAIAVVADGHGSSKYFRSNIGSYLAVNVAKAGITRVLTEGFKKKAVFFKDSKDNATFENCLKDLEKSILNEWRRKVSADYKENPITDEEQKYCEKHQIAADPQDEKGIFTLYGSTLVLVVITNDFWFHIQLGYGWCVLFDGQSGHASGALPYLHNKDNKTSSLCQPNALANFKHQFGRNKIRGAFVMTDGITESFPTGEQGLLDWLDGGVFDTFIKESDTFEEQLERVLKKRAKAFGDDCAMAGIFDYGMAVKLLLQHERNKTEAGDQPAIQTQDHGKPEAILETKQH